MNTDLASFCFRNVKSVCILVHPWANVMHLERRQYLGGYPVGLETVFFQKLVRQP